MKFNIGKKAAEKLFKKLGWSQLVLKDGTVICLDGHNCPVGVGMGGAPYVPVFANPVNVGVANAPGVLDTLVRSDHVHNHPANLGYALHHNHYAREIWGGSGQDSAQGPFILNDVVYCPIQIPFLLTIDRLGCVPTDGFPASNHYMAIYDSAGDLPVNRLGVTASVATTSNKQLTPMTVASLQLNPGLYFISLNPSNNTDNFVCINQIRFALPANLNNGLTWFYEPLGGYVAPPLVAGSVGGFNYLDWGTSVAFNGFVRVLSVP